MLQDNIRAIRAVLERLDCIAIPSHPASPIIYIYTRTAPSSATTHLLPVPSPAAATLASASMKASDPASPVPRDPLTFDMAVEGRLLQDIVDEALAQDVWITGAQQLRGQEAVKPYPSIQLAVSAALLRKECERAAGVVKAAAMKALMRRPSARSKTTSARSGQSLSASTASRYLRIASPITHIYIRTAPSSATTHAARVA
jgi:serine palmitoyltransferase